MFGKVRETPQTESTPFYPRSPYGVAKVYGHHITVNYRESYDLFACSGILFNHESERRGLEFVTRKITWHAAAIKHGKRDSLSLGNLDARRDWGWAPDYVDAMVRATRHDAPGDYVVATGRAHSVRDFVAAAFAHAGVTDWEPLVEVHADFIRPADPSLLVGDAAVARERLGWSPTVTFEDLVGRMVDAEGSGS
jgi:GDPmannose 4,6-dehydratase